MPGDWTAAGAMPATAAAAAIDPRGARLRLLGGLFVCAFLVIAVRLGELCLLGDRGGAAVGSVLASASAAAAGGEEVAAASRADILDRNGVLLATMLYTVSLIADPQQVQDPEEAAARLAEVLPRMRRETLLAKLIRPGRYALLKRALTPEEQQAVNDLGLPGIGFEPVEHRVYPQRELAAHVVGAVNAANEGTWGVERYFDAPLRQETAAGRPLVLSLDIRVQQILRAELAAAVERFRAKGGNGVVLDARTGEMLGMVSLPDFDPNWAARSEPEQLMDRNTRGTYEVGSVFKVFTVAAGLETGAVALTDGFDTSEPLRLGRYRIRDYRGHERRLSVPEILVYSSNIGAARIAQAVGPGGMHAFLGRLGLLARQGIELSGAAAPQPPPKWDQTHISTVAFGHGIAVTPLHVAAAMATVVNDGRRVAPTLVRRQPERAVTAARAAVEPERVLSPGISDWLRWLLWLNGIEGTGRAAQVAGYMVGGKSASAEKPKGGRYDRKALISSFTAVFPSHAPRYVVLAMLDEPQGDAATFFEATGGRTAAPVVRRVIERLGPLLGVPPAAPEDELAYRARLRVGKAINGRTKREERSLEAVGPGV